MPARLAHAAGGAALTVLLVAACGAPSGTEQPDASTDAGVPDAGAGDAGSQPFLNPCLGPADAGERAPDPYADRVVAYTPGPTAGFGQDLCPGVVFGPPRGMGPTRQSLDVLSLGREGVIVLAFTDVGVVDGEGVDLLVFENPLATFQELGEVSVSDDGTTWHTFPCAATDADGGYPGCAGVHVVHAVGADGGVDATDPAVAGGDGFDLAQLGVPRARFVRIRDTGTNSYPPGSGGFDLDAVAVVNGAPLPWSAP